MSPEWPEHFPPEIVTQVPTAYLSTYTFALEAWRRGLTVTFHDPQLRYFTIADDNKRAVRFRRASPEMTSQAAIDLTDNKYLTLRTLRRAQVPTPRSELIDVTDTNTEALIGRAEELGYPVVLKLLDGMMGKGVFTNIESADELLKRYKTLIDDFGADQILIESHLKGEDYRVLVIDGEVAAACLRLPANVTGDGEHTVDQLIQMKNSERKLNPFLSRGLIKNDAEAEDYLKAQGLGPESVPTQGQKVRLRSAANASAGGDVVDQTDTLAPQIRDAALRAVATVPDLFCCGADIIFDGSAGTASVIELNAIPAIGANMYPSTGNGPDVPKVMVDKCFPDAPRRSADTEKNLYFPMRPIREVLASGVTNAISVTPIPSHRYSYRRRYRFEQSSIAPRQSNYVKKSAIRLGVSGWIDSDPKGFNLVLAGSKRHVKKLLLHISRITGGTTPTDEPYYGSIALGFKEIK